MRTFQGVNQFSAFIGERIGIVSMGFVDAMTEVGEIIRDDARERIGEYQSRVGPFPKWADLADATMADRESKGYPSDEPLLRDGTLRESITFTPTPFAVLVGVKAGTPSPYGGEATMGDIAMWQEFGASRLGEPWIPPRPFLGPAAYATAPTTVALVSGEILERTTGLPPERFGVKFFPSVALYPSMKVSFEIGKSLTGGV